MASSVFPFSYKGFERRFVIVVDVLGWKVAVAKAAEKFNFTYAVSEDDSAANVDMGSHEAHGIFALLSMVESFLQRYHQYNNDDENTDLHFCLFSDMFVLSEKIVPDIAEMATRLEFLLNFIDGLWNVAIIAGFLLRGGIVLDLQYHKNSICFGPALQRAYELESSFAVYPRILLDYQAADFVQKVLTSRAKPSLGKDGSDPVLAFLTERILNNRTRIRKADDGWWFYNPFWAYSMSVMDGLRERLAFEYEGKDFPVKIARKINWFLTFFNSQAQDRASLPYVPIPLVGEIATPLRNLDWLKCMQQLLKPCPRYLPEVCSV